MEPALVSPSNGAPHRPERSLGDLFGDLAAETGTLVRQEVQLASRELSQKAVYAARSGATVAVGAGIGLMSAMALAVGVTLLLGMVMPLWGAALVVGAALGLVAFVVARAGYQALARMEVRPRQAMLAIKETQAWAQDQIR